MAWFVLAWYGLAISIKPNQYLAISIKQNQYFSVSGRDGMARLRMDDGNSDKRATLVQLELEHGQTLVSIHQACRKHTASMQQARNKHPASTQLASARTMHQAYSHQPFGIWPWVFPLIFNNISLDYKSLKLTWFMAKHSACLGYHSPDRRLLQQFFNLRCTF